MIKLHAYWALLHAYFLFRKTGLILELRVLRGRERRDVGRDVGELGKSCPKQGQPPPPADLCLTGGVSLFSCYSSPFKAMDSRYHSVATPRMLLPFNSCISGNLPQAAFWTCWPILLAPRRPASAASTILANTSFPMLNTWGPSLVFLIQGSVQHTHNCRAPTPSPAPGALALIKLSIHPHDQEGKVILRELPHHSLVSGSSLVIWEKLFT